MEVFKKLEEWKKENPEEIRKIQEILELTEKYVSGYQLQQIVDPKVEIKTISSLTTETTL